MNELKKLDIFTFRDKYGWTYEAVLAEALASAVRRADMMDWRDVTIRDSGKVPMQDGEFTCYSFEIWGIENQSILPDQDVQKTFETRESQGQAAREVNP